MPNEPYDRGMRDNMAFYLGWVIATIIAGILLSFEAENYIWWILSLPAVFVFLAGIVHISKESTTRELPKEGGPHNGSDYR